MNIKHQTINFQHLENITKGDDDFKKELIEIFLSQIPVFVNNLSEFYKVKNIEKLAREAHTAKSSVLIFGMDNTGKLLKEIQNLAELNQLEELEPALKQAISELNSAKVELQNL